MIGEIDRKALELVKLEGAISDSAAMGQIVRERITDARIVRADSPQVDDDETVFAVLHLCDMVQDLRQQYYDALQCRELEPTAVRERWGQSGGDD